MTSVHAYTSDQSLQDYAGEDYRRSRSGAENIIPNNTPALDWLQALLPEMKGKLTGYALNVPVQTGSMVDLTMSLKDSIVDINDLKALFIKAAEQRPDLIATTDDPIVSSDVRGSATSLLVDLKGSMLAGKHIFKLIGWHETLGHAKRILDIANLYNDLEQPSNQPLDRQKGAE
jgi:glyceraldehyde 3-phosphate dehydrogenase